MGAKIVVVGSLNMDLVVRAQRHPFPGETLLGGDFKTFPGGKGANQAVAAARVCAAQTVCMIGRVGMDAFGATLLECVAKDGVDTRFIQKDAQAASGVALITLDAKGQNTIVVAPGANARLTPEDIQAAEDAFSDGAVLLAQLETPLDTVAAAAKAARRHGMQVVLNPSPATPLPESLLADVDVLIPNESELALLSGENDLSEGIQRLLTVGVKNLVVTLGSQGVLVAGSQGIARIPAHTVNVVDTVAAGDAFAGAFAVALSEGHRISEAALWGNAAGALAVTRAGAQPSLPRREEIVRMING